MPESHRHLSTPDFPDADELAAFRGWYPLVRTLPESLQLVATPVFDAPGCDGPRYCCQLIVSEAAWSRCAISLEACRGLRAAYNDGHSNSGMMSSGMGARVTRAAAVSLPQ